VRPRISVRAQKSSVLVARVHQLYAQWPFSFAIQIVWLGVPRT